MYCYSQIQKTRSKKIENYRTNMFRIFNKNLNSFLQVFQPAIWVCLHQFTVSTPVSVSAPPSAPNPVSAPAHVCVPAFSLLFFLSLLLLLIFLKLLFLPLLLLLLQDCSRNAGVPSRYSSVWDCLSTPLNYCS